jgi:Na+-transporting methylmalonyl-CoA/oxaloacetate decarboxylase gamma subunit
MGPVAAIVMIVVTVIIAVITVIGIAIKTFGPEDRRRRNAMHCLEQAAKAEASNRAISERFLRLADQYLDGDPR